MIQIEKTKRTRFLLGIIFFATLFIGGVGVYNVYKPLPVGVSYSGQIEPVNQITFFKDLTWVDKDGKPHSQQEIFDQVLKMIKGARYLIVLDMFLFNDFTGKEQEPYRKIAQEVTDALVAQKANFPEMLIVVITDPINTVYNGMKNHYFERLEAENIHLVFTNLERLRDSNPAYSAFWRIFVRPFGNSVGKLLPNPFGKGRVSVRSYLAMFNFKANHRKLIICDTVDGLSALITSANPHDGSSAHGNVAIYFKSPAVLDLLQSEKAVIDFSGGPILPLFPVGNLQNIANGITVQILTEKKIKDALITALSKAGAGDSLAIITFYLSDRDIVSALKKAHGRGATVRVLLDPNKDAFGIKKNGIPNRQVANELVKAGIPVRWSNTHGEQAHTKMLLVEGKNGQNLVILGSANFTRRNLENLNLETNLAVKGPSSISIFLEIRNYVDLLWNNTDGRKFSVVYNEYADNSFPRQLQYRWMEVTGMSTF